MQDKTPLVIVYHANCLDGATSAWVVAKAKNRVSNNVDVTYVPYDHHDSDDAEDGIRAAITPGSDVYFVDVAPSPEFLDEILNSGKPKAVHVLDHHKTAYEELKSYAPPAGTAAVVEISIDPELPSASAMIWNRLLPNEAMPDVVRMIDKMDGSATGLKTPDDFAAAAMIDTRDIHPITTAFNALHELAQLSFADMVKSGYPFAAEQDRKIHLLLNNPKIVDLQILPESGIVQVPIVNGDVAEYGRQISTRLCELGKKYSSGIALIWKQQNNDAISVSIRSDGTPDASIIAAFLSEKMGITGGGHKDAAAIHFASYKDFAHHFSI